MLKCEERGLNIHTIKKLTTKECSDKSKTPTTTA